MTSRRFTRHDLTLLVICVVSLVALMAHLGGLVKAQQPVNNHVVARVTLSSTHAVARFIALGLDLLEMRDGDDYFVLTTLEQVQQLSAQGWVVRVDEAQTATLRQSRPDTFMGGYRTVPEMRAALDAAAASYSGLTQVFTYGKSYEGRDLFGIKLTNKQVKATKPTFFLMAAIHARELSTSELALRLVDYLLNNYGVDGDVAWLLDEHQIVVVPVANPDGHTLAEQGYLQRKNTDPIGGGSCPVSPTVSSQFGVDLNRNSAFKWGTVNTPGEDPCGQTYPGPTVSSEPETVALQNLVRTLFPDQRGPNDGDAAPITTTGILVTLHSYSDLVLWPWGWTASAAPNAASLSLIGRKFAAYNGYTPQQSIQLYPTSGTTDDWSYGELGVPSFTFEVGPSSGSCSGFFAPFTCLDGGVGGSFWLRNLPAFLYAARIARVPYQLVQGPTPETITTTLVTTNSVTLQTQLSEQYNGGQNVAAAEYYVDTPPWRGGTANPMTPLDGAFNSATEVATTTITLTGRHLIFARGQDANGNWGPMRAVWVSILPQKLWLPTVQR